MAHKHGEHIIILDSCGVHYSYGMPGLHPFLYSCVHVTNGSGVTGKVVYCHNENDFHKLLCQWNVEGWRYWPDPKQIVESIL